MKCLIMSNFTTFLFVAPQDASLQEKQKFPAPGFPSYLKTPKNVDEMKPYVFAAMRQIGGRSPLGLVEKGQSVLLQEAQRRQVQILLPCRQTGRESWCDRQSIRWRRAAGNAGI